MDEKSLEDQIRELREELNSIKKGEPNEKNIGEGIGNLFGDYIETIIMGVSDKIRSSIDDVKLDLDLDFEDKSDIDKKIRFKVNKKNKNIGEDDLTNFFENAPKLMNALADEKKLKILKILEKSSNYQKELSEKTNIFGGSFKYHMDTLIAVNFVEQEVERGKYKITQFGIESIKLVEMIYNRSNFTENEFTVKRENVKIIIDDDEDIEITMNDN